MLVLRRPSAVDRTLKSHYYLSTLVVYVVYTGNAFRLAWVTKSLLMKVVVCYFRAVTIVQPCYFTTVHGMYWKRMQMSLDKTRQVS